ncbi:hypothetical protein Dimus_036679, partial [Dionaea muscipula]
KKATKAHVQTIIEADGMRTKSSEEILCENLSNFTRNYWEHGNMWRTATWDHIRVGNQLTS